MSTKRGIRGIRFTKDGGLIIHPEADTSEGSSIRIPDVSTELGAGFGDEITDSDRKYAVEREPIAHFLTHGISADVFDKWFVVDDPSTESGDPKVDEVVQEALTKLEAKEICRQALEYERMYGWSLLVGSFSDINNIFELERELKEGSELVQLVAYPKTNVEVWMKEKNENSERFGEPIVYRIDRGEGKFLYIHHTRCHKVQTRSDGKSVLDPIWDDLTCGRNIRWGTGQWMYRTGGGFPVIFFPKGTTQAKLEEYADSGAFSNLMSRTYICLAKEDMDFRFEGAQGRAIDPTPFFQTNREQVSIATSVPEPVLRGAQAGAVTGSEVNQRQYFKLISRIQASFEPVVRWIIDHLAKARQIKGLPYTSDEKLSDKVKRWIKHDAEPKPQVFKYTVDWVSAFELTEVDQKQAELLHEQANQIKLQYMTVDEVRKINELKELPNGEGATLLKKEVPPIPFESEGDSYIVAKIPRSNDKSSSNSQNSRRRGEEEA